MKNNNQGGVVNNKDQQSKAALPNLIDITTAQIVSNKSQNHNKTNC